MAYRKVPIEYNDLKQMLRSGIDVHDNATTNTNDARTYWWPLLVTLEKGKSIDNYPDIKAIAKRLMDMVDKTATTTIITPSSVETAPISILTECKVKNAMSISIGNHATLKDIVLARCCELNKLVSVHKGNDTTTTTTTTNTNITNTYNTNTIKGVEEPLLLNSIITIIASIIESVDISHLILCDILSNASKYVTLNTSHHKRRLFVFKTLLSYYLPKTYAVLDQLKALDDQYLNLMFVDFFITLLPKKVLILLILLLLPLTNTTTTTICV